MNKVTEPEPKCPYCDFKSSDKVEQKQHLRERHYSKITEIAKQYNQSIEWAVGEGVFLFD